MKRKKLIISIILVVILILGIVLVIFNRGEDDKKLTDAIKFKEEYETLNGKTNESNGKEYRSISISDNNPFVYKEADDIVEMINNKETFVVYFGFDSCPWCRSIVPTLVDVADDLGIDKIYYVNVKDIRDTIEINEDGKLETTKKGTGGYYKLIEILDNVLEDYTLTDSVGNETSALEKRIYAPNVVTVVDGVSVKLESGISEKQTNAYMELTDEIKEDTYNKFNSALEIMYENNNTCDEVC